MKFLSAAILAFLAVASSSASEQTQPAQASRNRVAGTVTHVDGAASQLALKSDQGTNFTVHATDRTLVLRIPPGETDVRKGTRIALADVAPGDRVVAVSKQPIEGKTVEASAVLVMTKSDVAQVRQKEQEDWRRRGAAGTVSAVDSAARTITLKVGARTLTVQTSEKTDYRRYAPDSARFSDARPSSFAEVQAGDQLRVLGNRSEDGGAIAAEKIVFGTFRQIAATINSIDPASGEMKVTDLATRKPLFIRVTSDSTMRKLPDMMARMLARRYGAPSGSGAQNGPGGGAPSAPGGGRGGAGGRGGDIGQMLDNLPAMPVSELKPGDAIMVSTTAGSDPSHVAVVMLLAGVEPLLTASPAATRDIMSGWNLGGGAGEEGN